MNHVVGLAEVEAFTRAMALKIAALTPVVRRVHQRVAATVLEDLSLAGLTAEDQAFAASPYDTTDLQEGWRAFLKEREPQFRGR